MSEIVERVAKVLREIDFEVGKPNYSQAAKAVIEAMREPTKAMVNAADPHGIIMANFEDAWKAMIDEALK